MPHRRRADSVYQIFIAPAVPGLMWGSAQGVWDDLWYERLLTRLPSDFLSIYWAITWGLYGSRSGAGNAYQKTHHALLALASK